jgi:PAS domain S-box-containing protein
LLEVVNRFCESNLRIPVIPNSATTTGVIFAPHGRDAVVASKLLAEAGILSVICDDLAQFENMLDENAAFVVVTEEALRFADLRDISARLAAQPAWSDLPFIILTQRTAAPDRRPEALSFHDITGNVTLVERPFHPATFISVARTALKGRQRQFEARSRMEELHEGEERLQAALLAGRLGSWELDVTTWVLTASATCKALFGYAPEQPFSYEDLIQSIHPDDLKHSRASMNVTVEAGADCIIEFRGTWPDGTMHWTELRARLVRNRTGQQPRLIGVALDITDRKTSEETLRRINETLEEHVTARTAELTAAHAKVLAEIAQRERAEEQLRQSQKLEMIGQLTGGVAHDFNNLLMAVIGNLDLLRKHMPDDPKTGRLISGALQGAQRGAALTQRLLAFARRQDLKIEPRNLSVLIREAADLIERSAGPSVDLRRVLAADLPLTLVDANQIELAVLNLVINARDAMPNGGVLTITVDYPETSAAELPPGRYVRLAVSDTGCGMDPETLQKATEPFFSTKELGKGTGLGLSMVHGLAIQLKGALRLTSQVGVGTEAELWLPVTTAVVEEAKLEALEAPEELNGRMLVLVVDDDALIAMSTVGMLEDLGHEVLEAHSGDRALEILRDRRTIDLLLTDYSMPRMNGVQLAAAARDIRPDLPVLLATGYAELPKGSGPDLARIGKPYRQNQLAAEIAKVMKGSAGRRVSH